MSTAVVFFTGCSNSIPSAKSVSNPYIGKDISAYLIGKYVNVETAKDRLIDSGFNIVATYVPINKGTIIVFTNAALKAEASKYGRSNASILRLFVDEKLDTISITNPIYFGKAFMQDEFNYKLFSKQLAYIKNAFPELKGSKDKMKFEDLATFHFMVGMPYYQNPDILAEGTNAELLRKVENYKHGKHLIFKLHLTNTTTLLGYELGKETKKFVQKIGRTNAAILPWTITIENGEATALNAKYYIALGYPLLTMNDFMGIATVPGAITKELEKVFR
jgi:hypothetical protein